MSGADAVSVEVKNAYMEFNIPGTPSTAIIGVQRIVLLDSWIVGRRLCRRYFCDQALRFFKVTVGYVGGQYGWERKFDSSTELPLTNAELRC